MKQQETFGARQGDVFISYTASDERWALWIAGELEAAGHAVIVQARDFRPGSNFVEFMQDATARAERTLAVLSPAYVGSRFAAAEWTAAFAQSATGAGATLLPVRVAQFAPPGLWAPLTYIDLCDKDESEARRALLDGLGRGRAKRVTPFPGVARTAAAAGPASSARAFPGALPAVWTVPHAPNPHFRAREAELEQVGRGWALASNAAPRPRALHGLGGVGKTQLAVEYAWRAHAAYDAVLWIDADTPESVKANLAAQAVLLGIGAEAAQEQPARLDAVCSWLRAHRRWLLVFDNVDTEAARAAVLKLLPKGAFGHVLITSRLGKWAHPVDAVPLGVLAAPEAAQLLVDRTSGLEPASLDDASAVARALGGLPLALEQAAAYVQQRRIGFDEYLRRLQTAKSMLMSHPVAGTTDLDDEHAATTTTWSVTEAQLDARARALLRLLSFFAPEDIPRSLLLRAGELLPKAEQLLGASASSPASSNDEIERSLVELADYSFVTLRRESVACHRLVAAVQRSRTPPEQLDAWLLLASNLLDAGTLGDVGDVRSWPAWEALRPHIAELVAVSAEREGSAGLAARWMFRLGQLYRAKALWSEAEPLLRGALTRYEGQPDPDRASVALALNGLALLLQATNRAAEAEPLMRRALQLSQDTFGPQHTSVARDLNNLAQLLHATGRRAEAEPLLRRALAINEEHFGSEHPAVASSLNNLALLLHTTQRRAEAEPLLRRALEIHQNRFGSDHPTVATSLNNLAQLLHTSNRGAEAEPLLRSALAIDEKSFGHEHPHVARDLNNLAQVLKDSRRLDEAEPLMRAALAIDEKSFGPAHPTVVMRLDNLARLLRETQRLAEAEPLMRRSLAILEKSRGALHPDVAKALDNLATLLQAANRAAEAEFFSRRALSILERRLGH